MIVFVFSGLKLNGPVEKDAMTLANQILRGKTKANPATFIAKTLEMIAKVRKNDNQD